MSKLSATAPIATGVRLFMLAAAVFVAAAGISLFFLGAATSHYFAWTIQPPVTAAFLGGGYLAVTTAITLAWLELPGLLLAVVLLALFAIGAAGVRGHLNT